MLQLSEIRDAFPEGKAIVNSLIKGIKEDISNVTDWGIDIRKNKEYSEDTKNFLLAYLKAFYIIPNVEEYNRLSRYYLMSDEKYNNDSLEKAKAYPIEQLFEIEKPKATANKTICSCPLPDHSDKTPSFCIYHSTNTFYCFSCHTGGDTVKLVQLIYGIGFKEALQYINKKGDK